MDSVFVVQHLHVLPHGEENVKFIGVYRSMEAANAAVARLASKPGFCDFPNIVDSGMSEIPDGFYIDEYHLDVDQWEGGYATVGTEDD